MRGGLAGIAREKEGRRSARREGADVCLEPDRAIAPRAEDSAGLVIGHRDVLPLAGDEEAAPKTDRVIAPVHIHQIDERRPVVFVQVHPILRPVVPLDDRGKAIIRGVHPELDRHPSACSEIERRRRRDCGVVVGSVEKKRLRNFARCVADPAEKLRIVPADHIARMAVCRPPRDSALGRFHVARDGHAHLHEIAAAGCPVACGEPQHVDSWSRKVCGRVRCVRIGKGHGARTVHHAPRDVERAIRQPVVGRGTVQRRGLRHRRHCGVRSCVWLGMFVLVERAFRERTSGEDAGDLRGQGAIVDRHLIELAFEERGRLAGVA